MTRGRRFGTSTDYAIRVLSRSQQIEPFQRTGEETAAGGVLAPRIVE